jgi:hypothetical protein
MTVIEGPIVRVYGNVAVASFVRIFNTIPHNQPPNPQSGRSPFCRPDAVVRGQRCRATRLRR